MKITISNLLLLITSCSAYAQQPTHLSVSGGVESYSPYFSGLFEPYATGWNAGGTYSAALKNTSRFTKELGLFTGITEYNGPSRRVEEVDTTQKYWSFTPIMEGNYAKNEFVYYSKHTFLRLTAGVNYLLFQGDRLSLSAGAAAVMELTLRYWERGKAVLVPTYDYPGNAIYYDFKYGVSDNISNIRRLDFQIQPTVNLDYQLNDKCSLLLRGAYLHSVSTGHRFTAQLNTGVRFKFNR